MFLEVFKKKTKEEKKLLFTAAWDAWSEWVLEIYKLSGGYHCIKLELCQRKQKKTLLPKQYVTNPNLRPEVLRFFANFALDLFALGGGPPVPSVGPVRALLVSAIPTASSLTFQSTLISDKR